MPIVQPYLTLYGRTEEALEFYKKALGAETVMLLRFNESPDPLPPGMVPDGWEKKVMHSAFRIGDSLIMASDGCEPGSDFKGFSLSITVTDEADADKFFNALGDGGKVDMPLGKTFWSPRFGMVTDKFGITWMVNFEPPAGK
jgi:PhnB protein